MRASGAAACVAVIVLLLLPLFYVLSVGPAIWLHDRGMMSPQVVEVCGTIYSPLDWVGRICPPVMAPIEAYASWWRLESRPPINAPLPNPPPPPPPTATAAPAVSAPAPAAVVPSGTAEPDLSQPAVCR